MGTKQSEAPATPQTQGTNQVQNGFAICFPSPHPLSWSHHSYHFFFRDMFYEMEKYRQMGQRYTFLYVYKVSTMSGGALVNI